MADAYIYDAVRTPRGKGKKDGSLHEITGLSLATQVLEALRDRNDLDTSKVDDVILGCVTPVGELGADIAYPPPYIRARPNNWLGFRHVHPQANPPASTLQLDRPRSVASWDRPEEPARR